MLQNMKFGRFKRKPLTSDFKLRSMVKIEQGKDSIKIRVLRAKMRHMKYVCATFAQVTRKSHIA